MTNFDSAAAPGLNRAPGAGASCLRAVTFPWSGRAIAELDARPSTVLAHAVPRVRGKGAAVSARQDSVAMLLGQATSHNYMTGATAVGEGAAGPTSRPPRREPV